MPQRYLIDNDCYCSNILSILKVNRVRSTHEVLANNGEVQRGQVGV